MLKRNDYCLVIFLLAISFLPLFTNGEGKTGGAVYITVHGQLYRRLGLNSSPPLQEIKIKTAQGENTVLIKNGTVSVSDADCRDKICVRHPPISQSGEVIACLPHEILIEIREE